MIDRQYVEDMKKEVQAAREEHLRKMLVELIDRVWQDFNYAEPGYMDRDDVINLVERFVTKRRRWL